MKNYYNKYRFLKKGNSLLSKAYESITNKKNIIIRIASINLEKLILIMYMRII